jgi:uncharacterized protein (TIGR02996 family)
MAVYFVYRCYYIAPGERYVRRFEANNVVDWFRSIWKPIAEEEQANQYAEEVFGVEGWTFSRLFLCIAGEALSSPEKVDQVMYALTALGLEVEPDHGPHHLQFLMEDGDNQEAVYFFDDHFRAAAPGLTDFLLLDGWELPGTWSDAEPVSLPDCPRLTPHGDGDGTLYAVDLFKDCKYNLDDLAGGLRVEGVRVPDLCRFVLTHPNDDDIGYGLFRLRAALQDLLTAPDGEDAGFLAEIRDDPGDLLHWSVYSDWLTDRGLPPAGLYLLEAALRAAKPGGPCQTRDPARDLIKVIPHMAQACKHEEGDTPSYPGARHRDIYTQWIFFDDRWVAAHPTLAAGLLEFAARWDVLSTRPREGAED